MGSILSRKEPSDKPGTIHKPQGRVLVVDFGVPQRKSGFLAHFHRHGHVDPREIITLLDEAGLRSVESGPVGISSLQFVLAVSKG